MDLKGKVALITGGGTGIGAAVADRFVKEGAKVCITGRRREVLDNVASKLPAGSVITCTGDVGRLEDARKMVDAAVSFGGKLDVLVNNAGIDTAGTIVDMDLEVWRRVIDTNLTGPFLMMKAALPHMIKARAGSIINVASLAGVRCIPGKPAYCSSKAGMIMLTQPAALDYGPFNIRCNAVCPGPIRTEMLETSMAAPLAKALNTDLEGALKHMTSLTPLARAAYPEEMTGACVFLASDDSTYMTGAGLMLDGGTAIVDAVGAVVSRVGLKWGGA